MKVVLDYGACQARRIQVSLTLFDRTDASSDQLRSCPAAGTEHGSRCRSGKGDPGAMYRLSMAGALPIQGARRLLFRHVVDWAPTRDEGARCRSCPAPTRSPPDPSGPSSC